MSRQYIQGDRLETGRQGVFVFLREEDGKAILATDETVFNVQTGEVTGTVSVPMSETRLWREQ